MRTDEWVQRAVARLEAAGIESARLDAQVLAAHVLLVDRSFVLSHPELEFPELAGEGLLQRRESREPLAYILGYREFYGRRFGVGPGVLIPRQETETLVEVALECEGVLRVLDMGTGSGCIAITLKLERPQWTVLGADVSQAALGIARRNAEDLGTGVGFIQSDAFGSLLGESFDLIVSNPPYIGREEPLMPEVGRHEPGEALFGGDTGLEFYRLLADEALQYLVDGGKLMMEVGYWQAEEVCIIFESKGWHVSQVRKDLAGTPRVVVVQPIWVCG